mmetsp:Transcript_79066/g.228611  ORF Transcript_79066/g.228611 Transcript_79066/m.228611 type:complete len:228 (-) Transcript_79066:69-752(-)
MAEVHLPSRLPIHGVDAGRGVLPPVGLLLLGAPLRAVGLLAQARRRASWASAKAAGEVLAALVADDAVAHSAGTPAVDPGPGGKDAGRGRLHDARGRRPGRGGAQSARHHVHQGPRLRLQHGLLRRTTHFGGGRSVRVFEPPLDALGPCTVQLLLEAGCDAELPADLRREHVAPKLPHTPPVLDDALELLAGQAAQTEELMATSPIATVLARRRQASRQLVPCLSRG